MKKTLLIILTILLALLICVAVFWDPIIDFLPIDQSGWAKEKDTYYYLDEDGDPIRGWMDFEGKRYHFDSDDGAMQTGWLDLSDGRYYLGNDGVMRTGWMTIDSARYYLGTDGRLASGWLDLSDGRYYFGKDGTPTTGWLELEGIRYYFNENGTITSGWQDIDGARYYMNEDGIPVTGWLETEEGRFYLSDSGSLHTGWLETEEGRFYLNDSGSPHTGWLETEEGTFYLNESGVVHTGWLETEDGRYYLNESGAVHSGWLEEDGTKYYIREDGRAAVGHLVIDEKDYYFTSTGANIILVNRWNYIPEDYSVELTKLPNGREIAVECYDALMQMVEDCKAYGCHPNIIGANRSHGTQTSMFNSRILEYQNKGYNYGTAYALTMEAVAVPGTSEHELGLAVDILDVYYPKKYTGDKNCMVWLNEHCWEYGFIVRYPDNKKHITGIKFEPWHYRYVGVELAMELRDSGLCLEEYLDQLTNDGTTCGNPEA